MLDSRHQIETHRPDHIRRIMTEIMKEMWRSNETFPGFNTPHEGLAVLMEEYEELKDEVKAYKPWSDTEKMYQEACQVAAMGAKFMLMLRERQTVDRIKGKAAKILQREGWPHHTIQEVVNRIVKPDYSAKPIKIKVPAKDEDRETFELQAGKKFTDEEWENLLAYGQTETPEYGIFPTIKTRQERNDRSRMTDQERIQHDVRESRKAKTRKRQKEEIKLTDTKQMRDCQ